MIYMTDTHHLRALTRQETVENTYFLGKRKIFLSLCFEHINRPTDIYIYIYIYIYI